MKYLYLVLSITIISSCRSIIKSDIENKIASKEIIDYNDQNDCNKIISENLYFLENAIEFYPVDFIISENVKVGDVINCGLDSEFIKNVKVQEALIHYCKTFIDFTISKNIHPTYNDKVNHIGRILSNVINKECFDQHLRIFSYNDCIGHEPGTEQSTGVGYFEYMMLPLILTINGMPANDFYKEYKLENYFFDNREDCGLNYYNKLYHFIKQAWEEGKIELKDLNNK